MPEDLMAALGTILERIRADQFGGRDAPYLVLHEGTGLSDDGALVGGFDVNIRKRDGTEGHILAHNFKGISSVADLEGSFADALSKVLARHRKWPR